MDEATIQKIAAEVVARLPFGDHYGLFLVINVLVMALAAALAAFAGSYLKTRGQHFATKADFDSLQDQLSAQTRLVETIKSDVAQKDWAQREWANLRRLKLEALFDKMRDCDVELERRCHALFHGPPLKDVPDYMDYVKEFEQISTLYLPELQEQTGKFTGQCLRDHFALLALDENLREAGEDSAARRRAYDDFNRAWKPEERLSGRYALQDAARRLLVSIMGVEEEP
jgi:hypothetical protein